MPLVKVKKSITGFEEVGQLHDSKVFGDQLERLVRKGCLEPLEDLQLPAKPPGVEDLHAEIELLTEKIGGIEKGRDEWKAKAIAAVAETEDAKKALRESEATRLDLTDKIGKLEKDLLEWKAKAMNPSLQDAPPVPAPAAPATESAKPQASAAPVTSSKRK